MSGRVRFEIREQVCMVEELLDQWYGLNDSFFKVRADDGNLYILRREGSTPEGTWTSGVIPGTEKPGIENFR